MHLQGASFVFVGADSIRAIVDDEEGEGRFIDSRPSPTQHPLPPTGCLVETATIDMVAREENCRSNIYIVAAWLGIFSSAQAAPCAVLDTVAAEYLAESSSPDANGKDSYLKLNWHATEAQHP
ncbi:hypothetical protein B0H13DRAFT_2267523 [Mycena leptocephala]|nr:hypothetical protein B0H13DRAFT_2267523 [Mycena leptocephala]